MKRSSTIFVKNEASARINGRKGRFKSPWNVPYNANALNTIKQDRRVEMIRMAAQRVKS